MREGGGRSPTRSVEWVSVGIMGQFQISGRPNRGMERLYWYYYPCFTSAITLVGAKNNIKRTLHVARIHDFILILRIKLEGI